MYSNALTTLFNYISEIPICQQHVVVNCVIYVIHTPPQQITWAPGRPRERCTFFSLDFIIYIFPFSYLSAILAPTRTLDGNTHPILQADLLLSPLEQPKTDVRGERIRYPIITFLGAKIYKLLSGMM